MDKVIEIEDHIHQDLIIPVSAIALQKPKEVLIVLLFILLLKDLIEGLQLHEHTFGLIGNPEVGVYIKALKIVPDNLHAKGMDSGNAGLAQKCKLSLNQLGMGIFFKNL